MAAIVGTWPLFDNGLAGRSVLAGPGLLGGGTLANDVILQIDPAYVVTALLSGLAPAIGAAPNGYVLTVSGGVSVWAAPSGDGDVDGPASSTDNAITRFDGTTGKLLQNSLVTIGDTGNISLPALATFDGRDVSIDGTTLDTHVGSISNPHATTAAQVGAPPTSRSVNAGDGLIGGGDLSTDRTLNVVANADGSIQVNPNDIQVGVLATDAQHGDRGGGSLHSVATTLTAGFMSTADKLALEGLRREQCLNSWVLLPTSLFPINTAVSIAYGNGIFVAVGAANGFLATSTDGTTWTPRLQSTPIQGGRVLFVYDAFFIRTTSTSALEFLRSTDGINWSVVTMATGSFSTHVSFLMEHNGSVFVAMSIVSGGATQTSVYTSSNGITWATNAHGLGSVGLFGLAYGNGVFSLLSTSSIGTTGASYSLDGTTWIPFHHGALQFNDVAYGASVYVAVGTNGCIYSSDDGAIWKGRFSGTSSSFTGVTFANSLFIAFGASGTLATSPDGTTWTLQTSQFGANAINSVAFGASLYVAAGAAGTLATSPDGTTWTLQTSQFGADSISKVRFLNSLFVAVGGSGKISTSSNGTTWSAQTSNVTSTLNDVTFGNSAFVAVGNQQASIGVITSSPDGTTWTARTSNFGNNAITNVMFDSTNTLFVAGGANTTNVVTSPDGTIWTARAHGMAAAVNRVIFANSLFVAVGGSGKISTSSNGTTWSAQTSNTTIALNSIIYGAAFVAVGGNGTTISLVTSPDGTTWTSQASMVQKVVFTSSVTYRFLNGLFIATDSTGRVAISTTGSSPFSNPTSQFGSSSVLYSSFGAGIYVIVGVSGNLSSSPDGYVWTARTSQFGTDTISVVRFLNSLFVAAGAAGKLSTSPDGTTWTAQTSQFGTDAINDVTFGNSIFITVGNKTSVGHASVSADGLTWGTLSRMGSGNSGSNMMAFGASAYVIAGIAGYLASSFDGVNWIQQNSMTNGETINSIIFANGLFVAAGAAGKLSTSPDGTTWTAQTSQFGTDAISGLLYANGLYLAYGSNGKLSTSPDGITWTLQTSQFGANTINSIIFANSLFVAAGGAGKLSTSPDGTTWTAQTSQFGTTAINALAFGLSLYVAVGNSGIISTSPDGTTWTLQTSRLATNLTHIVFGMSIFVIKAASSSPGGGLVSTDGINWNVPSSLQAVTEFNSALGSLAFSDNRFMLSQATATGSKIHTSDDGILWQRRMFSAGVSTNGTFTFFNDGLYFVLSASNGDYLRSVSQIP